MRKWLPTALARRLRRCDEGGAPMQPVGQQQCLLGHLRQQLQRQRPLRLAAPPDGRRQGIVQAQFEQHARGDFGEGRAPAPGLGLAGGGFDLRRVGQTELRAVQGDQPPAAPERVGLGSSLGQRPQAQAQQLGKDFPRQAGAAFTEGTLRQGVLAELGEMFGQSAGGVQDMEDQGLEHPGQRDAGLAATALGQHGQSGAKTLMEGGWETGRSRSRGRGGGGAGRRLFFIPSFTPAGGTNTGRVNSRKALGLSRIRRADRFWCTFWCTKRGFIGVSVSRLP